MFKKHNQFLTSIFFISDLLIISISWILAYYIRFSEFILTAFPYNLINRKYIFLMIIASIIWTFVFKNMGLYKQRRVLSVFSETFEVLKASIYAILILVSMTYFLRKDEFSRLVFFYFFSISFFLISLERLFIRELLRYFRTKGYNIRTVLIVGAGNLGVRTLEKIKENPWTGLKVVGFIDDHKPLGGLAQGEKIIGRIKDVRTIIKDHGIDQILIALPIQYYTRLAYIMDCLRDETVTVRVVPDIYQAMTLNASIENFEGMPMINLTDTPLYGWSTVLKRMFDIFFSLFAILILSPLLLFIACTIKLTSKGPIIFKQHRYGLDGCEIKVYKFRSMNVCEDGEKVPQAKKDDSRITPFGAFLRRTSLDEIPQFFNVLQGRMSIVGPRPHAVAHNEEYRKIVSSYMLRHKVKPGITGWAQVNGWRGETDTLDKMEKRVEHDLYYIENWSIWLDLKIMWLTVWKGLVNKNAY